MALLTDVRRTHTLLDLEERLRAVPSTALIRGIFFRLLEDDLKRRGYKKWGNWRTILGEQPRPYRLYPVRDLLIGYAEGAQLLAPNDPGEGIRQIFQGIARPFSSSWYGKAWLGFMKPDLLQALYWLERSRDLVCNYGSLRVESRGKGRATLHWYDEYFWIETAHRGGCEGMLDVCGVVGEVTAEADTMFNGRLNVRWEPRASD